MFDAMRGDSEKEVQKFKAECEANLQKKQQEVHTHCGISCMCSYVSFLKLAIVLRATDYRATSRTVRATDRGCETKGASLHDRIRSCSDATAD